MSAALTRGADLSHLALLLDPARPLRPQLAQVLLEEYGDLLVWIFRCSRDRTPIKGERWTRLPLERAERGVSSEAIAAALAGHLLTVPDATIGLCAPHGIVFFDADSDAAAEYLEAHAPPEAPIQATPRGCHVPLRYAPGTWIPTTNTKTGKPAQIAPGIEVDVRSGHPKSKGFVNIWPSRGRGRRPYAWLSGWPPSREQIPLAPAAWLRAVEVQPEPTRPHRARTVSRVPDSGTIPQGQRDETLFRIACRLQRLGLSDAAIEAELLAINATRCSPPLPESVVVQKVRSALRYEKGSAA